jgi:transposase
MLSTGDSCQAVPNAKNGIVIGVDIAKGKIDYGAFRGRDSSKLHRSRQDADGFADFKAFVEELYAKGYEPWVAFEPTGPYGTCFKEWLQRSDLRVVQVNPYHVKRTKEVRDNSPRKTDLKDPRVIADLVWQGCYQEVRETTGEYALLRCAIAEWASLAKKRTAIRNEFQGLLEVWFPELRDVFKDAVCKSVRAIVRKCATAEQVAGARLSSIRSALKKGTQGRTVYRAEEIISAAKRSIAPKNDQQARRSAMLFLLESLELIELRREQLRCEMDVVLQSLSLGRHLLSMPYIGVITVGGLLGECGDIGKYGAYAFLEKYIGLNLFEVSSGKHRGERHITKRGRALARYLICHIALLQTRSGGLYDEYAKQMRAKGTKTGQIRVAVARKLLRVLYAMARDLADFDPQRFAEARTEDGLVILKGTQQAA